MNDQTSKAIAMALLLAEFGFERDAIVQIARDTEAAGGDVTATLAELVDKAKADAHQLGEN